MPLRLSPLAFVLLTATTLGACTAKVTSKLPDGGPVALSEHDLKKMVLGHYIRDCEGPTDGGPLIIKSDGSFEKVTGFGGYEGNYSTHKNMIVFVAKRTEPPIKFYMKFYKNAQGAVFYTNDLNHAPIRVDLQRIDSHAHDLTCARADSSS